LEFIWEQEISENPEQENLLMNKLSSSLRDEVYLHTNVQYLKGIKTFEMFTEKTLIKLSSYMKKLRYSPEEHVYKVNLPKNLKIDKQQSKIIRLAKWKMAVFLL
jgi:hypothetical protein